MSKRWMVIIVATIFILWTGYFVATGIVYRWQFGGPFGDTFGALNTLFSGLAMGGVIMAIFLQRQELILQRQELRLQREELVDTRRELARSAEAQEEQVKAVRRQSETLRVTAELNARASLMQAYVHPSEGFSKEKWEHQLGQLERVLEELDPQYQP